MSGKCNTRNFVGVGELEQSGYIPRGSSIERNIRTTHENLDTAQEKLELLLDYAEDRFQHLSLGPSDVAWLRATLASVKLSRNACELALTKQPSPEQEGQAALAELTRISQELGLYDLSGNPLISVDCVSCLDKVRGADHSQESPNGKK